MIQTQTKLRVIDNSGAKLVKCIKVLGGYKKKTAKVGDSIIVSTKKIKINTNSKITTKIKKGTINKALILRTKKATSRKDGSKICFMENAVAILDQQGCPFGTRISGIIPKELKFYNGASISVLSGGVL